MIIINVKFSNDNYKERMRGKERGKIDFRN